MRVWRRLLERHGADAVPVLIFAGQLGWKVEGLLAELEASNYLDGKIELRRNLSDAALQQAYRSCQFTIFPSLCEGWGLPVAESLVQGKICVASNRTSIPEVGGDFVDYFDPTNEDDAMAKIERLLFEPGYLQKRETRLRNEYNPPTWADCVLSFMAALDRAAADGKDIYRVQLSASVRATMSLTSRDNAGIAATRRNAASARSRRVASSARQERKAPISRAATCGFFGSSAMTKSATKS